MRLEDLEDVKQWIAAHDGKITAYWEQQHSWNKTADHNFRDIYSRLTSIEKKIMWVAGMGATLGAFLGVLLPKLLAAIG